MNLVLRIVNGLILTVIAQKRKFSIKDFFSKCDQIRSLLTFFIKVSVEVVCKGPVQPAFACSKLTRETLEQGVKYVQS